jgi:hypothetical protein
MDRMQDCILFFKFGLEWAIAKLLGDLRKEMRDLNLRFGVARVERRRSNLDSGGLGSEGQYLGAWNEGWEKCIDEKTLYYLC